MGYLDKYSLNIKGLSLGEHDFKFSVDDKFFSCFEGGEISKGNAGIDIILTKKSNMLTLDFNIEGEVMVACDRCLDEFMIPVKYEGTLFVKYSEEEKEEEADVIWISERDGEINLAQYIYDSIALSLPYQRVHPMDKNGDSTCNPDMLERFRIVSEEEFEDIANKAGTGDEEDNASWENEVERLKEKLENNKTKNK